MINTEINKDLNEMHPLFPSGEWEGFYTYAFGPDAQQHKMSLDLIFKINLITGSGSDDIGSFSWRGTYNTDALKCTITKHYASHTVFYEGSIDENGIWGTWSLTWGHGGFHIWPKPSAAIDKLEVQLSEVKKIQIKIVVIKGKNKYD